MSPSLQPVTRRRVLFIGAVAMGAVALSAPTALGAPVGRWRGQALGAHCLIELVGASSDDPAFAAVEAEIRRLEAVFSLYRADSELARLNRDGVLDAPSPELIQVLSLSKAVHQVSGGLFDPTVQPLFDLYARHFAAPAADPLGPGPARLDAALACVGLDGVEIGTARVRFARPGMALTLNGIAQGFVTDRVADLLRARGFTDMLLDVGEIRALGSPDAGGGWTVRVNGPGGRVLRLVDEAVATSDVLGTTLDPAGAVGHIFDPRRGRVAAGSGPVTVVARSAALADALSTAAVLAGDEARALVTRAGARLA